MNLLEHLFFHYATNGRHTYAGAFELAASAYEHYQKASKSVLPPVEALKDRFDEMLHGAPIGATSTIEEELRWRTVQTWEAHLAENNAFFRAENGTAPSIQPTMTPDIRKDIRDALKLFDAHLLTPDKREEWKKNSKVRAAGVGIFLDPFCCGTSKDNNVKDGGKRYLDHWRPWRHQRGKGHPVERFAQLYFEARDVRS